MPADFLLGIDLQRRDFETGGPSYFAGTWRDRGVWWYYIAGLGVKMSSGTLLLFAVVVAQQRRCLRHWIVSEFGVSALLPLCAILLLVSSQSGLNEHLRYVFPALPLIFVIASGAVSAVRAQCAHGRSVFMLVLILCSIDGMCSVPNSIAYTNFIGRCIRGTEPVLMGSSLDWGQDAYRVCDFHEEQLAPQTLAYLGVGAIGAGPILRHDRNAEIVPGRCDESVGTWNDADYVAVSLNYLYEPGNACGMWAGQEPAWFVGATTAVFKVHKGNARQRGRLTGAD